MTKTEQAILQRLKKNKAMTHKQAEYIARKLVKQTNIESNKPVFNMTQLVNQTLQKYPNVNMILVDAPRNNGKTTSTMELVFNEITDGRKFIWIRNQAQQAEASMLNFLQRYGEFGFNGSVKSGVLKDGHEEVQGHFLSLNSARRTRSGAVFNDSRLGIRTDLIIYDEFNELEQDTTDLLDKLVKLVESIQRDNPACLFICIGNRDTPTNKLTHKLGLKPNTDFENTYCETIENAYGLCVVYRIGNKDYRIFRPQRSISGFLAQLSPNTRRFIHEGGYLEKGLENVLNYEKFISPTFKPLVGLIIDGKSYTLGQFEHYEKGDAWALVLNYYEPINQVAFDEWSDILNPNSARITDGMVQTFARLIFEGYKSRQLYFDEFETLEEISSIFT